MFDCTTNGSCSGCPDKVVCRCLQVTEEAVLQALATFDIETIKDLRRYTGAGDGCTACHRHLRGYLDQARRQAAELVQSASPSPSSPAPI